MGGALITVRHTVHLSRSCGRAYASQGPNHGALTVVGERECVAQSECTKTAPTPSGATDAFGHPLHVLHEEFMSRLNPQLVGAELPDCGDVHVYELCSSEGDCALAHVVYVRLDSPEWCATADQVDACIESVCARVSGRDPASQDGAGSHTSPAGGFYVATGSATRGQRRTATLPHGTRKVALGGGVRTAPYRHTNYRDPHVQRVGTTAAPLMGAAARVLQKHVPEVYDSMWEHARANPLMGLPLIYPSPGMQDGRCASELDAPREGVTRGPSLPTQHLAVRVAGAREGASGEERARAALGVSNHHVDTMDGDPRHGVPIVFVPDITHAARARLGSGCARPLPASDLVLAEGSCEAPHGDRAWRIVTCKDKWACIVVTHYKRLMHGNVYPCGRHGALVDGEGVPYLARSPAHMPPGVRLARLVCYTTTSLDSFVEEVQAEWNACMTGWQKQELAERIFRSLDAPLDARFLACLGGEG